MKEIPKFKACKCPRCGQIQTTESLKRMVCVYCNKTSQFRVRSQMAVKFIECQSGQDAAIKCSVWREHEAKKKEGK